MVSVKHPKPFFCKECGAPITRERLLKHGLCQRCYSNIYNRLDLAKQREYCRQRYKVMKKLGMKEVSVFVNAVKCPRCGNPIKGRFSRLGKDNINVFKSRHGLRCPYCRFVMNKGDRYEIVTVRRWKKGQSKTRSLSNWNIYRQREDVQEFLETLPEHIETVKELRRRTKKIGVNRKEIKKLVQMKKKNSKLGREEKAIE